MKKLKTYSAPNNLPLRTKPAKVQEEMQEQLVGDRSKRMKGKL